MTGTGAAAAELVGMADEKVDVKEGVTVDLMTPPSRSKQFENKLCPPLLTYGGGEAVVLPVRILLMFTVPTKTEQR